MEAREELAAIIDSYDVRDLGLPILDAMLAHPDLVIAALGGEPVANVSYLASHVSAIPPRPLYVFPVREGTD